MKAIVLERKGDWAAVLCEDGVVTKTRQKGEVGETIELETTVTAFTPKRSVWRRSIAAAAVAVMVLAGSFAYVTVPASASVSVTVGESEIEIGINRIGRVVSVNGKNDNGIELAESLKNEMKGRPFDQAFERCMDRFEDRGMIDDDDEFVMVRVNGPNERRDIELREKVIRVRDGEHPRPIYFDGEMPDMPKMPGGGMHDRPAPQGPGNTPFESVPQGGPGGMPFVNERGGQPPQDGSEGSLT